MDLVLMFNPEESAKNLKIKISNYSRMTVEIVDELHKAKEYYSNKGVRNDLLTDRSKLNSFKDYLSYIGLYEQKAYRWLERYIPEEQKLLTYEELTEKKNQERLAKLSEEERKRSLISQFRKTGQKPDGWDRSLDYRIQKDKEAEIKQKERTEQAFKEREQRAAEYKTSHTKTDDLLDGMRDALHTAASNMIAKTKERDDWKEKIRLSDGGKEDAFMDAIIEYLETLENDSRRIEACSNIIKICRNISVELQSARKEDAA